MTQDWRDDRYRDDDRYRRGSPSGDRGRDMDRYQGSGYGGSQQGGGRSSGDVWRGPQDDFASDWGTGIGDRYDDGRQGGERYGSERYGSERGRPGFPSLSGGSDDGRRGYDVSRSGSGYSGGRGTETRGEAGYGAAYSGDRVNMDRRGGLTGGGMDDGRGLANGGRGWAGGYVEPGYASGDFRGQQGGFHEERGYGSRRQDDGWWGGPTGSRTRDGDDGYLSRGGGSIAERMGEHRGRGPRGYRRSDERIRDDVNDRLTDDPMLDARAIDVEVKDGEVTLSGTVDSRRAKRHAEDLVEAISGVTHCQNNLRIHDTSGGWTLGAHGEATTEADRHLGGAAQQVAGGGSASSQAASGQTSSGTTGSAAPGGSTVNRQH